MFDGKKNIRNFKVYKLYIIRFDCMIQTKNYSNNTAQFGQYHDNSFFH